MIPVFRIGPFRSKGSSHFETHSHLGAQASTRRTYRPPGPRFVRLALAWVAGASLALVGPLAAEPLHRGLEASKFAVPFDLSTLSGDQLAQVVHERPTALGSLSLGYPHNGQLLNPVQPQSSELFEIVAPDFCYGTEETVAFLERAVRAVHAAHPATLPLHLGHISKPGGGYLSPHLSHQSGRDVDLGYYYKEKRTWYRRATAETLDVERTWTLVKALITETDVEFLFIDRWVQTLLKSHAQKLKEDPEWLKQVFAGSVERPALIRHAPGHATHIHVRFFNPKAQENARIAYPHLISEHIIEPVVVFTQYTARKGDTLGRLAKRYGTTVRAIQQANGLRGTTIVAKRIYKIPKAGGPAPVAEPVATPARVLPFSSKS
jgi:murein endopeptidase